MADKDDLDAASVIPDFNGAIFCSCNKVLMKENTNQVKLK